MIPYDSAMPRGRSAKTARTSRRAAPAARRGQPSAPRARNTPQRQAVQDAIEHAGVPVSAREILSLAAGSCRGLGLATVYRTLKILAHAGIITQVEIAGQPPRFELAGKAHHHHFHCNACGRVFELDGCCGHFAQLTPAGFQLETHDLTLFGRCDRCASPQP